MARYCTLRRRSGNILVLSAVLMVVLFGMVAFAVDIGYVALIRTESQAAADSAAMAAAGELLAGRTLTPSASAASIQQLALASACSYTQSNPIGGTAAALAGDDVVFGRIDPTAGSDAPMTFLDPNNFNAVRVMVRRSASVNGEVPMFFAKVLGTDSFASQAEATAAFIDNFSGFNLPPAEQGNLNVLPFAVDEQSWNALLAGTGSDDWTWDEGNQRITHGSDGVLEVNLFPQGTGSPGNRGTVDIGNPNNSTRDISRQIREGVNENDLSYLGGKLELGADGTLQVNGDTGISAGVKDDFQAILGKPRIIPIFRSVVNPGNNAMYTLVQFAGVRVMEVNLTGKMSSKRVIIQPAIVKVIGGIPASDDAQRSNFLYSPVWLVR